MRLNTLVNAMAATCAALLLLLLAGLAIDYQDSRRAVADSIVIDGLQAGMNDLRFVMVETILYAAPRSRQQWDRKQASMLTSLDRQSFGIPRERVLLNRIRANHIAADKLYKRLTGIVVAGDRGTEGSSKEAQARTVSSLMMVTQEMLDDVNEISRINQASIVAAQGVGETLILITVLLVGATMGGIWWLMRRRVLSPIALLQKGTAMVAAGSLEHRLGLRGHDEIGSLARAFDTMTEQLQSSREKLTESEARYRLTMAASSVGMWDIDLPSGKTVCDARWYQMLGFEPDAFRMSVAEWRSRVHPEDLEMVRAIIEELFASEETHSFEFRFRDSADHWRWLRWRGRVMEWQDGKPKRAVGTQTDISARKAVELALLESEELKTSVLKHAAYAIIATDPRGIITVFNPGAETLFGYRADELIGKETPLVLHDPEEVGIRAEVLSRELGVAVTPGFDVFFAKARASGTPDENEWTYIRKDGTRVRALLSITARTDARGQIVGSLGIAVDITSRKIAEDEIRNLAFYDPLTQLPNRRLLLDRLGQALASSARSGRNGALLFIDLDNFKTLNDTLGHDKGDLLLQQVAERLATCVREGDTVARLGGDEFVVMLEGLSGNIEEAATQTETVGEKVLATFDRPYLLVGYEHHSTPSIGATLFSGHQNSIEELLKKADLAMYQSKAAGRNTLRFFDPEMQAVVTERAALEVELREALRQQQFILHYQPQVVGEGRLTGAEVLVRWQHPQRGMVSPAEFIPLAEETGLILPLGYWVLKNACAQQATWAARPEMSHLTVAVNVSAHQFHHKDFVDQVLAALDITGANPQRLKLELTESVLVSNVENTIAKMAALKARGVGFSLDDFGTGYSSLSYLKRLPLDQLKIDRSFVRDVLSDPNDASIARTIIALAQNLGLGVIAEGVETEAQRDFLATSGCHAYQGHFFSRPLPVEGFEEFVMVGADGIEPPTFAV